MNRRSFLQKAVAAGVPLISAPAVIAQAAQGASQGMKPESKQRIEKAAAAALAMQRQDWEQGILAHAFLEAGDRQRVILLTKAAMVLRKPDGRLAVVVSGGPTDPSIGSGQATGKRYCINSVCLDLEEK